MAVLVGLDHALDEGVDDLLVALQGEDQGHVDRDALGQGGGDGRQALQGGGDLDHGVGTIDLVPKLFGLLLGLFGVVGQTRIDLDGDASIHVVGLLGNLAEDVGGVAHVGGGQLADGLLDGDAAQLLELLVIGTHLAQCLLENRGVGGHAHHIALGDQLLQIARLDAGAAQIVQPDRDT